MINKKNLLLLSSSRVKDTAYLEHAKPMIRDHLAGITELLFIPYAGVSVNHDDYTSMVQIALADLNIKVTGIHQCECAKTAVASAQAIAIGGGNTFNLLTQLYHQDLLPMIRERVADGMPYIGWSAGSNVAGASIKTTNDMPIIEPPSFDALQLIDFQLNPHYTDFNPPGHHGETREQRLAEFMIVNPTVAIVALVEGTALKVSGPHYRLLCSDPLVNEGYLFKAGTKTVINSSSPLAQLLSQ